MPNKGTSQDQETLKLAIDAVTRKDLDSGRRLINQLLLRDPNNLHAWLLMYACAPRVGEKVKCLEKVLTIDPNNKFALEQIDKLRPLARDLPRSKATPKRIAGEIEEDNQVESAFDSLDPVHASLEVSRRELLDLGLRNSLINYRPLKVKGVEVVDEMPKEIFRLLITEGRKMSFLPIPEGEAKETEGEQEELFKQPEEEEEGLSSRHTDNKLQTPYPSTVLQKRLLNTYYAARTIIEEQGVNVLFLAFGMLQWYESDSSSILRKAPLILVPVELSRTSVKARFRLHYTEEDIGENLSLKAKLRAEFGIKIPDLPDIEDLDVIDYFRQVQGSVQHIPRWSVEASGIALGFFSFGKFLMYHDLDADNWSEETKPYAHPILRSLLHEGFQEPDYLSIGDGLIDEHVPPDGIHQVVDADSSQTLAILEVNNGRNLVIQGPPGTGKSQTITNVIAEAIGNGKTVLFVSEKMAALQVVKRRLDSVGLGAACLELHSHKTKKKEFLDELKRTLEIDRRKEPTERSNVQVLIRNRDRLNNYCLDVNRPIGESRVSPYDAYGKIIQLGKKFTSIEMPPVDNRTIREWSSTEFSERLADIEEYQVLLKEIGIPNQHPFWGSKLEVMLPAGKEQLVSEIEKAQNGLRAFGLSMVKLAKELGVAHPTLISEVSALVFSARYAVKAPELRGINIKSEKWETEYDQITSMIEVGKQLREVRKKHDEILLPKAWEMDLNKEYETLLIFGPKWWRLFSGEYRKARNFISSLSAGEQSKSVKVQLPLVRGILEYQDCKSKLQETEAFARELFGAQWNRENSSWEDLEEISQWQAHLYQDVRNKNVLAALIPYLATNPDLDELKPIIEDVEANGEQYLKSITTVIHHLEFDSKKESGNEASFVRAPFNIQWKILHRWHQQIDKIQQIISYNLLLKRLRENDLDEIVKVAEGWAEAKDHLVDLFRYAWFGGLLEIALKTRPNLAGFNGNTHSQIVRKFQELDKALLEQNRSRLAHEHWTKLPRHAAGGQLGLLRYEFQKKRRHLPIRKLIIQAANAIQAIKPIFMMSPMSIAMYLPPESINFDLVVFDEASQVRPVDAFGAILRGRQVVVVGDDKQLPPTSFFERMIDTEDDDTESLTKDIDSILQLMAGMQAPSKMLRWHYRSLHESLISVSNYEFYDNSLVIFPSPDYEKKNVGLVYHYLPDTAYDRGKSRVNIGEAKSVAEAVIAHARSRPHLTLGVAAFSSAQEKAILDQLEIIRRQDSSYEIFFSDHAEEPFFVKNLENVQGDERDVIFISIGYGRTADGTMSMNFGPLNQVGGERRLNVLITRARQRCEVFTNLTADDIDLRRSKSRGVVALKRYLNYAQKGALDIPHPTGRDPDSPFEAAVARTLTELGYEVEHQVGSAGFFIDLAIVDQEQGGRYLMGIECDGATYHSAQSARDRDRLRQEVLESRGWWIHRIWSTDWFNNPQKELQRTVQAIEASKKRNRTMVTPKPNAPKKPSQNQNTETREQMPHPKIVNKTIPEYRVASLSIPPGNRELHEVPRNELIGWIKYIVEVESPIHVEEVARRIANAVGTKRVGRRISESINSAAQFGSRSMEFRKKGNFLWKSGTERPTVRNRSNAPASVRNFELVAPEEIAVAIEMIVSDSFGIRRVEIPQGVSRLLGFKRATKGMYQQVNRRVGTMLRDGKLIEQGDFMVLSENK